MYNKEYYLKLKAEHPEKIKEYSKKAYQRGKEKFLENSKELYYKYKVEKPEALKEYAKKSYEKLKETNPEKLKEQQRVKDNLCLYICYFSENCCFFLKIEN